MRIYLAATLKAIVTEIIPTTEYSSFVINVILIFTIIYKCILINKKLKNYVCLHFIDIFGDNLCSLMKRTKRNNFQIYALCYLMHLRSGYKCAIMIFSAFCN